MLENISQVAILILGTISIILIAKKNKWGPAIMLFSQPFWFVTAFLNKQWGVFIVSIIYTISWGYSAYSWFLTRKNKKNA